MRTPFKVCRECHTPSETAQHRDGFTVLCAECYQDIKRFADATVYTVTVDEPETRVWTPRETGIAKRHVERW